MIEYNDGKTFCGFESQNPSGGEKKHEKNKTGENNGEGRKPCQEKSKAQYQCSVASLGSPSFAFFFSFLISERHCNVAILVSNLESDAEKKKQCHIFCLF